MNNNAPDEMQRKAGLYFAIIGVLLCLFPPLVGVGVMAIVIGVGALYFK